MRADLASRLHWAIIREQKPHLLSVLQDACDAADWATVMNWVSDRIMERRRPYQETLRFAEGVLWREGPR